MRAAWWIAVAGVAAVAGSSIVGITVFREHATAGRTKLTPSLAASLPVGSPVEAMVFSPDGRTLAVRLGQGGVQLRNAVTGTLVKTLVPAGHSPRSYQAALAFSPDGKTIALDADPRPNTTTVNLISVATGQVTTSIQVGDSVIRSVAFSPDGATLAIAAGPQLILRDLATHASIEVSTRQTSFEGDSDYVTYSADGKWLVVASNQGLVKLWNVATTGFTKATTIPSASGADAGISAVSIGPDGATVALSGDLSGYDPNGIGYRNPETWLWHPATGKTVPLWSTVVRRGPENGISAQALSPDGKLLATGDYQGTIRVWDLADGKLLATEHAPSTISLLPAVVFAPDGKSLATAQSTGTQQGGTATIQLWDLYRTAGHPRPSPSASTAQAALRPGVYKVARRMAIVGSWVVTLDSVRVEQDGKATFVVTTQNTSTVAGPVQCTGAQGASLTLAGGQVKNGTATFCPDEAGLPAVSVSSQGTLRSYAVFPDSQGLDRPFTFVWSGPSGLSGTLPGITLAR